MIVPIPLFLLPHNVTHIEKIESDEWNDEKGSSHKIERVRLEPKKNVYLSENEKIVNATIMFVDAVNSTQSNFKTGDEIVFNDEKMTIKSINKFYDMNKLHHLELVLL